MFLSNKPSFLAVKTTMRTYLQTIFVLFTYIFTIFLTSQSFAQQDTDKFVVVLDAGHGGKDSGNLGNGHKEKSIALKVVLEVGKALEKNPNIKVIYTRKTDVFLELHERAAIANKADADLFISIHCNAHHSQAYGTETFVLGVANTKRNLEIAKKENEVIFLEDDHEQQYKGFDPDSPESTLAISIMQEQFMDLSILLAQKVENNFKKKLKRKSRGLKQASLWVLHNTYMPSVLIELGFLTNKKEGAYLNSKKGQTKVAGSIKNAVLDYKKEVDQNIGTHIYSNNIANDNSVDIIEEKLVYTDIAFKVQIAASKRKLEPKSYNFNGLSSISREKVGRLYKYYFGSTSDYNEIKRLKEKAKEKGYTTSFIVAFKDGKGVDLNKVLKTASN